MDGQTGEWLRVSRKLMSGTEIGYSSEEHRHFLEDLMLMKIINKQSMIGIEKSFM